MTSLTEHTVGELAYADMFAGLIPCKVSDVRLVDGETRVVVKLTAARDAYERGEVLSELPEHKVVPRGSVYVRSGQYRIRNNYRWVTS